MPELCPKEVIPKDKETALAQLLDRAFEDDPIMGFVVPDAAKRVRAARALHQASVRYALRYGVLDVAQDQAGVALWLPPGREQLTLPRMIQTGFLQMGLRLGTALPRLLQVDGALSRMHCAHAPRQHWYLFFLAVDPGFQGQGVGTALLKQGMARAAGHGLSIYLETQTKENVAFYTRRGFVVQQECAITPMLTNWALLLKNPTPPT